MKTKLIFAALLTFGFVRANAAVISTSPNALIPDNDPSGYVSTINVSGLGPVLDTVAVSFNFSGGYNGDLYVYLAYNGQLLTLLNRPGTPTLANGYDDTGFNIVLSDSGATGLHNYRDNGASFNGSGQLTGTWRPDSGGPTFSSVFGSMDPNGAWALFVADMNPGDQSRLESWSLDVTAVPEPITPALIIFGVTSVAGAVYRTMWKRRRRELLRK